MDKRRLPIKGDVWKHFKGKRYVIVDIAEHTETKEKLVIYHRMSNNKIYARPVEMFMSEVDHEKYPNVTQKYRFELVGGVTTL